MSRPGLRVVISACLILLWAGASAQGIYPGVAVRVNGVEISYERFHHAYEEHLTQNNVNIVTTRDPQKLAQLRREAMDLMIDQELVWQAAEKQGIAASPEEVDEAVKAMESAFPSPEEFTRRLETEGFTLDSYRAHLAHAIAADRYMEGIRAQVATVSDADLEAFYRDNPLRLTLPEEVRARHILLTWKPLGKPDDRAALREQMGEILKQAREGTDFAELAKARSEDSSAENGGDLGFFHRGEMVADFEAAAFALQPGEISDLVETPYGVHIIKMEERRPPKLLPLDEVRERLRDYLRGERSNEAVNAELARLREAATIEILIPL
ncbi:MAG: peptidylprolyl isomerase [Bdellovibrio bacteriovorus]